jgi:hypothetical protein
MLSQPQLAQGGISQDLLVDHACVVGTTKAQPRIHWYNPCAVETAVGQIKSKLPQDVGTVLLSQGGTRHYLRPHKQPNHWRWGCEKHPIYHGGGLLPGIIDRKTRVLTPGVYTPPGKWAVRLISYLEVLLSKEVLETLSKELMEFPPASDQLLRTFLPRKCSVLGFQALLRYWNMGGGKYLAK